MSNFYFLILHPYIQEFMKSKILLSLTAMLFLVACGDKAKEQKAPVRVRTEVAGEAGGGGARSYVGIVEERQATAVSFTSMGVLRRVYVEEGQPVGRGQLLAELDPSTSGNMLDAAQASTSQAQDMVAQMQSTYDQAKDAYDRMKKLHDSGSLPEIKWIEAETRLKQAETALRTAQTGVRSSQASERIARKGVSDTRLYAPASGIIGRKNVDAGETAMPSQAVCTILDISSVKVKVSVPEAEMLSISSATPSTVTVDAVGMKVQGGRIEKGSQADALTHTYDVRINLQNPQRRLLPGMVAQVQFGNGGSRLAGGQVLLPVRSVQRRADGTLFVWTIDKKNTAHRTSVNVGATMGNRIVVTSGVTAGQQVVVEGYQKLSEGSRVVL